MEPADREDERPRIWREPVLFVRPRNAGLSSTLDFIIEDLAHEQTITPDGLSRIVGVEAGNAAVESPVEADETLRRAVAADADILFSKPANAEQFHIAERLARAKAALVQGPPGTGKTHTIANLLGHLLAQGKTVLVTAHTTKALRVLREQIVKPLQPLCLRVLESDAASQAQLSRAAQEIADRLSGLDAASYRREAGICRHKRRRLLDAADALQQQIRDARFSEIEEIVLGGEGVSPIDAAKHVQQTAEFDGWIHGPLQPGILCPLSDAEVRHLYRLQGIVSLADVAELSVPRPELANLVSAANFRLLAQEQVGATSRSQHHRPELWRLCERAISAEHLQALHQRVQAAASLLSEAEEWLREVLYAGWTGGGLREAWDDLLNTIDLLAEEAGNAHPLIMTHGPQLPDERGAAEVALVLDQIVGHLERGGSLGFKTRLTQRAWHQLIDVCRVEDRAPQTLDEFRALRALARIVDSRNRFAARWRRAVEALGGPAVEGKSPERTAQGLAEQIRRRLDWRATAWEPLIAELDAVGFSWERWLSEHPPVPGDHGELTRVQRAATGRLAEVIEAQAALLRQAELSAALLEQRIYLASFPQSECASVLLQAQDEWDAGTYETACQELARLEALHSAFTERYELLAKLAPAAPAWARAVETRQKPHDRDEPPGDVSAAWCWCQWKQELDRRAGVSLPELEERLSRTRDELHQLAAQIVELETWAAQRERTGLNEQMALQGFVKTQAKITKTRRGVRDAEMMREARRLLAAARRAVPVWIMPLGRVYESFDPRETKFDVVIIDEASQSDVTALAALYLGCEHVVVGDKEQVTPDAVGQRIDQVQRLISTDLQGIPNSHLYDGQMSIYDLAEMAFGGVIALREHFRCVPEIIQFSNYLSYNQTIQPLREPLSATVRPALVPHRVNGYRDRGDTNSEEAEEIAALVIACIEQPEYALNEFGLPTTFGIITLLADEQALLIDEILRQRLPDDARQKRRLLCGNAAQFQGDERDVVFLSVVDGPQNDGLLTMRDAGPHGLYKKRYNVAVSRARNQLWVVHSVDPATHLKPGDLRRRLIEHARDPEVLLKLLDREGPRTESLFEKQVLQRLVNAGYRVQTQWQVGASRIDLVVEGTQRRLAVECDGERWHTPEKLHEDMERQAVLERLGWVFVRIRGSLFFRDPDAAMAPLFAKLQQLEIEPLGPVSAPSAPVAAHPLVDRVRRRAQELRAQWRAARASNADSSDGESTNGPSSSPETAAGNLGNRSSRPTLSPVLKRAATTSASPSLPVLGHPEIQHPELLAGEPTLPLWTSARKPQRMSLAVEVGDSVRYCFADTPNDEAFVTIVPYKSNPTLGMINAETAVAKALLGHEKGGELEVALPSGHRRLRVLAVHKHRRG